MDNPDRAGEWQPYLVELSQESPDRTGVGTEQCYTFQYPGRRFSDLYVLTAYEPMSLTAYKSLPDASIQAAGENQFESVDNGTRRPVPSVLKLGDFSAESRNPWRHGRTAGRSRATWQGSRRSSKASSKSLNNNLQTKE
jgi:hypothetical protein